MGENPVAREELDREILAFIEKGIGYHDEEMFNNLALKEFNHQYYENQIYQNLCRSKGVSPGGVTHWSEIPPLPTNAFKETVIASFPLSETELSLLTSGTTDPHARGKIYRDKNSLEMIKRCNYMLTKEFVFPDVERMRIMLLVPSPKAAPGMPMAYGLEQAKNEFGTADSKYYITPNGLEVSELIADLNEAVEKGDPICLMGATSGFVFFYNQCCERGINFKLPPGSRVCDGGGYQGTFGECSRERFYEVVNDLLGIPAHCCVNTLGMGESGTNYFDNVLRDHLDGITAGERYKCDLPWTRTIVVGIRTGQHMPKGELGLIRHYDLTNRATVLAVQTDNIGYETDQGFEILGRSANVPGYDVQLPGGTLKDWILGTGGGHPCSTVADGMMKQGHPCSTVADRMIRMKEQ